VTGIDSTGRVGDQMQGRRMFGLIEADLASTRQFDLRDGTPSLFVNSGAVDVLAREGGYLGFEIVAHEIKFVSAVFIRRVDCSFCRRQGEDQPAMASVYGFEAEDVAEECAIGVGIFAVEDDVSA
jgi:hypothetical protein